VHCLCWADTEEDSQDFRTAHSLIKRWIEVCGTLLDKREVKSCRVRESEVGHLILGIVMDVLGHVRMENRKGSGLGWTSSPSWDVAVLDSSEFVVLLLQISLEDFGCS
jgi:hypothetical protein